MVTSLPGPLLPDKELYGIKTSFFEKYPVIYVSNPKSPISYLDIPDEVSFGILSHDTPQLSHNNGGIAERNVSSMSFYVLVLFTAKHSNYLLYNL